MSGLDHGRTRHQRRIGEDDRRGQIGCAVRRNARRNRADLVQISGIRACGGEIFDTQGGGLQALCAFLLGGELGNRGAAPREWRGLLEHKGPVIFFDDGTGLNKNASGLSLWAIVDDVIGKALRARGIKYSRNVGLNPLVPIRVRSVNAKFCSAAGVRSFWISSICRQSITDYTNVVWDKAKPDVQKYGERGGGDRWLLSHLSDGDGYMIAMLFPMGHDLDGDKFNLGVITPSRIKVPQV